MFYLWYLQAGSIQHTAPCFGYVIEDEPKNRPLRMDLALQLGLTPNIIKEGTQKGIFYAKDLKNGSFSLSLSLSLSVHKFDIEEVRRREWLKNFNRKVNNTSKWKRFCFSDKF